MENRSKWVWHNSMTFVIMGISQSAGQTEMVSSMRLRMGGSSTRLSCRWMRGSI